MVTVWRSCHAHTPRAAERVALIDALLESELKDALAAAGCAVCRIGEQAAVRYLRAVLHESVNDLATRRRLLAAWGFCLRHAWYFLRLEGAAMRDGLSTAILAEGLLEALQLALDGVLATTPARTRTARGDRRPLPPASPRCGQPCGQAGGARVVARRSPPASRPGASMTRTSGRRRAWAGRGSTFRNEGLPEAGARSSRQYDGNFDSDKRQDWYTRGANLREIEFWL